MRREGEGAPWLRETWKSNRARHLAGSRAQRLALQPVAQVETRKSGAKKIAPPAAVVALPVPPAGPESAIPSALLTITGKPAAVDPS